MASSLPLEFTIAATPVSHQSRDRVRLAAWREAVAAAARYNWPVGAEPSAGPLRLLVVYYHEGDSYNVDGDNLLKPIQDALQGIVYRDDRQIVDAQVQKRSIDWEFQMRRISRVLADAFVQGDEFVYVKVEQVTDLRGLPQ